MSSPTTINKLKPQNFDSNSTNSHIGRIGIERLDFLLLLVESIEINGVESMLLTSTKIGLDDKFRNKVDLWKSRTHNPLRKTSRRGILSKKEVESLITLISASADRLYPLLRQLLSNKEPDSINEARWKLLTNRFNDLISERMNLKRVGVRNILEGDNSYKFIRNLVFTLSSSTGPAGLQRLRSDIYELK